MRPLRHVPPAQIRRPTLNRLDDDRGIALMLGLVALVPILIVSALVLDGGAAYAQRRQGQNAADDAATAGARQLYEARFRGANASTVATVVTDVAEKNGATSSTCTIIRNDAAHSSIGTCSNTANVQNAAAGGVRVVSTNTRATFLGGFAGQPTVTANTTAAATIQPVVGTGSPFIICGGPIDGWDILTTVGGVARVDTAKALALNSQNGGKGIDVQSSKIKQCGAGSAFKGKADANVRFTVPGNYAGNNGNGFDGIIQDQVLGATPCPEVWDGEIDCDIALPIADTGNGNGNDIDMHLVALTIWHISGDGHGNPKYAGRFVGNRSLLSSGQGGTGTVTDASTPAVIKLVE